MRLTATALLAVAGGVVAPVTVSAQLQIAPQLGLYVPRGDLVSQGSPSNPSEFTKKRPEGSIMLGVRAFYWATKRIGVVAGASFAPSLVAVTDSLGTSDQTGAVLFAQSQVLAVFTSEHAPWSGDVGLGAAVVSRTGAPWHYASGATAPALVVSLGLGTPLSWGWAKPIFPRQQTHVTVLRLEVADYISRAQFDKGLPTETTAMTHHDFTGSIMFCFPVGGR